MFTGWNLLKNVNRINYPVFLSITMKTRRTDGSYFFAGPAAMQQASLPAMAMNSDTTPTGPSGDDPLPTHCGLWKSLWDGQWNATLGSLFVLLLFVILSVVMVQHMQELEPELERRTREFLAQSHDNPFRLCPALPEMEDVRDANIASLTDIVHGTQVSCYDVGTTRKHNETWHLPPLSAAKLAVAASITCNQVETYCYDQEDLRHASIDGRKLHRKWYAEQARHANDSAYCIHLATFVADPFRPSQQLADVAEVVDILEFHSNTIFVVRLRDLSGSGRIDYVLNVKNGNTDNRDFYWLLNCALHPLLENNTDEVIENVLGTKVPADLRKCLTSNTSTVTINITRDPYWQDYACFKGVDMRSFAEYQNAYSVMKLKYHGWFEMTYDTTYAVYTGLLGGLIAASFLCAGNIVYQIVLKVESPWPWCCKCARLPRERFTFDGRSHVSEVSLPFTTKFH